MPGRVGHRRKRHCEDGAASEDYSGLADGGDRTHTLLPVLDFESSASANSATSAFREEATTNPFATKRKRQLTFAPLLNFSLLSRRPHQVTPVPDLFHRPTSVLGYQRIVIPGENIQYLADPPAFPHSLRATHTFRTKRALLMRLTGELRKRTRNSSSVRTASCRNVQSFELARELETGLTASA